MIGKSLRLRLLAGAAVAILTALVIAWIALTILFQRHLELRVEQELQRYALQLVAGLEVLPDGSLSLQQTPVDPRFDAPAGGLYWQVSGDFGMERSRSLWDQTLSAPPAPSANEWQARYFEGPFGDRLIFVERLVQPNDAQSPVLVQLALDENEIFAARAEFGRAMGLFLAVLWLVLAGAAWVQVHLGLRPLTSLRNELAALRINAANRLSGKYPSEIEPLTQAINDLAIAREADLRRARQRSADLAHGMKTPLAALAAQSRLVRQGGTDPQTMADNLDRAVMAAASAVEGELARARAAASRHNRQEKQASPGIVARRLISVLERTDKGMRVDYEIALPENLRVAAAEEDVTEILGPLLENAVRFARRSVRVSGNLSSDGILISVEDDGPGIDPKDAAEVLRRGARLDQVGGGHGLGLAIARELVEATGGLIALGQSSLGGLRVDLRWASATGVPA